MKFIVSGPHNEVGGVASCDEGVAEWAVLDVAAADGIVADQVFAGVAGVTLVVSEDHACGDTGSEHHVATLAATGPTRMYSTCMGL